MIRSTSFRSAARWIAPLLLAASWPAAADDIDIFIGSASTTGVPNVLFVVDNSSNWAAQKQAWPSGVTQGGAELAAMKSAVASLTAQGKQFNVGLMLITPCGSNGQEGGFVVHHVQSPTAVSGDGMTFGDRMQQIINSIGANQNTAFNSCSSISWSPVLADVYRYFKGANAFQTKPGSTFVNINDSGTNVTITDPSAYAGGSVSPTARYISPVSSTNQCSNNYVIFIGNKFPGVKDSASANELPAGNELQTLGSATARQVIPLQDLGQVTSASPAPSTTACVATQPTTAPITCSSGYTTTVTTVAPNTCSDKKQSQYTYSCTTFDFLNTYSTPNSAYFGTNVPQREDNEWADEWTRYLNGADVVPDNSGSDSSQGFQNITTYTIDPYYQTRDNSKSKLLKSMADVGGGKYFAVTSEGNLAIVIGNILGDILAKSSTFAAASLPISAANRTQNNNQVFIGMFRPDQKGLPRWFGNLKQYKLVLQNGLVTLGDRNGTPAISTTTGFVNSCAVSEWASDSPSPTAAAGTNSGYWFGLGIDPPPETDTECTNVMATKGSSTTTAIGTAVGQINPFSDLPDGPFVEKGGTAEVIRRNNDGGATSSFALNRNMFGIVSGTFGAFGSSTTDSLVNWTRGRDVNNELKFASTDAAAGTLTRPSLHGDVIHSRPLAVNYNFKSGTTVSTDKPTVVYYGANDGTFRAIDATTGVERWSFVDYDAFNDATTPPSKLQRLMDNSLVVSYPNFWPSGTVSRPRDYFFDGSIGLLENADNSKVWIYPVQRRGGAMIYAFDVSANKIGTTTDTPSLMWRFGCRTPGNNCVGSDTTIAAKLGQTWATPIVAPMASTGSGYGKPVVVVGGGYDTCEDTDTTDPASACSTSKGRLVVILDAETGTVVRGDFPATDGSVAADVSVIAVANDKTADYAYAADTRGNIYRIDFATYDPSSGTTTPLAPSAWRMGKIASTGNSGKKFLFAPAVYWNGSNVYIAIGSGDREHPLRSEKANGIQNRFYVFKDDITVAADHVTAINLDNDTSIKDYSYNSPNGAPTCTTAKVLPGGSLNGWFLTLSSGEQVVTSAVIFGGAVTFSTNLPTTANACTNTLGEARGYWLNLLNASSAIGVVDNCNGTLPPYSTFIGGGLPPSPVVANVDLGDGAGVRTIMIGAGDKAGGNKSSPIGTQQVKVPISSTRRPLYWFNKAD
jgi:type IV pilus assembly protein PilY1